MATTTKPNPFPVFSQLYTAPGSVTQPESEANSETRANRSGVASASAAKRQPCSGTEEERKAGGESKMGKKNFDARIVSDGLAKLGTHIGQCSPDGELSDLAMITEGLSLILNVMADDRLELTTDHWHSFALSVSSILDLATERANAKIKSARESFSEMCHVIDEMQGAPAAAKPPKL
jgi:hypothetical protein